MKKLEIVVRSEKLDDVKLGTALEIVSLVYEISLSYLGSLGDDILVYVQDMGNRTVNNVDYTEEYGKLDKRRQTGSHRVDVFLCVELHCFFIELFLIVCVLFFQSFKLRLDSLHGRSRSLLLDRKRENDKPCDKCKKNDRNAVVFEDSVNEPHDKA